MAGGRARLCPAGAARKRYGLGTNLPPALLGRSASIPRGNFVPKLWAESGQSGREASLQRGAEHRLAPLVPEGGAALHHDAAVLQGVQARSAQVEGLVVPRLEDGDSAHAGAALAVVLQAAAIRPVHRRRAARVAIQ
eukprot:CAMPEP_0176327726 /NCGR_PEP_ID=MMETSP0121_2-20121125/74597_1 /TAXON_ID=160619 /ORGANISM="Kryptoperidinium foliaceum, Strain CCMP 1326" /LENGTH=136 /DNA_ID=CAMNT_0017670377 /DNA_START=192 /DNA_END=599 /DNA_ORIENTATION=-